MILLSEEEVRAGGYRELLAGSDPMVMEDAETIVPRASSAVAASEGEDVFREREEGLLASFNQAQASGVTPERAREDLRLARGMGVSFGTMSGSEKLRLAARLEEMRAAYRPAFARVARERPVTARFLSDPGRMLLARNDIERLDESEGLFATAARAHRQGTAQTELAQLMGKKAIYGMTDEHVGARIRELRAELDSLGYGPREGFASWVWSAVNTLPQMERQWLSGGSWGAALGAAAGAAAATKYGALIPFPEEVFTVPAAMYYGGRRGYIAGAMRTAFEIETGSAYDEFLEVPGVTEEAARVAAVSVGVINSGIEALEAVTLVSGFPGGKAALNKLVGRAAMKEALTDPTVVKALGAFAKRYARGLTFETAQEMVQEVVNILAGRALKVYTGAPQESLAEDAARVAEVGVESFKGFSLISAAGPTTSLARDLRRVRGARSAYNVLTAAAQAADDLSASEMGPEMAREFTAETMAGSPAEKVWIPGQVIAELHQSGHIQNYEEFLSETLGLSETTVSQAAELGNYLEVEGEALVFAPEPLRNELLREAKFSPEELSENERALVSQELEARRSADLQMALVEADELRREDKQGRFVRDFISAQVRLAAMDYDKMNAALRKEGKGSEAGFTGGDSEALADTAGRVMEAVSKVSSREWTLSGKKMDPKSWLEEQGLSISFGEAKGGLQQSVWHGSPHRFDRFSLEHIGSGEGAQAFGWGLYFAGNKEVARHYRERLTRLNGENIDDVMYKGRTAADWYGYWESRAERGGKDSQKYYDRMSMLEDYDIGKDPVDIVAEAKELGLSPEAVEWFDKTIAQSKDRPGALYKADIPDDGDYLMWDEKVSDEQGQKLLEALSESDAIDGPVSNWVRRERMNDSNVTDYISEEEIADEYYPSDVLREYVETYTDFYEATGEYVYNQLKEIFGSPKDASLWLKEHGIPGIKYLDGNSRGDGGGSYNYVVFDDQAVEIQETFYQSLKENASEEFKKALPDKVFLSFDSAKEYLKSQLDALKSGIANEGDSIAASLGMNGVKKMLSGKAAEKSLANGFTLRDHITAAASVAKLYRNSELLLEHSDEKNRRGVTRIKRFGAPVVLPDAAEPGVAYITVRELYGEDNKIYSVELVSFELLKSEKIPSGNLGAGFAGDGEAVSPHAEGISRLSEKLDAVKADYLKFNQAGGGFSRGSITLGERMDKDGNLLPKFHITLSPGANKSTVFHEFGHLFFYDLMRRAALPGATERTRRDYETLKDWLGWEDGKQTEWTTEQHEQFARGFEAYLFEGKAPSVELRGVFRTIRDWMARVYRELRNLNVELSDEVRCVFDRLLATDAAIEEAKVALAIEADNDMALLSPEAKEAAQAARVDAYASAQEDLQSHILREVTKRARSSWKRAFNKLEPEVRRAVESEGVYANFAAMREAADLRLSLPELRERFGEEAAMKLPAEAVSEGGLDLDTAAVAMGFNSADDMVGAFVSARPFEEEVRARTDAAVAEKYPEKVMTPENMERLAGDALLKYIGLEENIEKEKAALKAAADRLGVPVDDVLTKLDQENQAGYLSKASKTRRLIHQFLEEDRQTKKQLEELKEKLEDKPAEKKRFNRYRQSVADLRAGKASALKDAADAAIGQKVYTEAIRASSYVAAAERYRRQAVKNEVDGDYEAAFRARELESINMAMAKSAREAADETGEIHKYLLKYANREAKRNFGVAPRYLDQIDALLARFDLRRRRWDHRAERPQTAPSLSAFALELERDGEMLLIPESMLNEGFRVPFAKMTVEEIRDLRDIVKNIEHVGRNENRLYKVKGMQNAATAIKIICDRIKKYHKVGTHRVLNPTPDAKLPFKEKSARGKVSAFASALNPVEYIMREIDGYEDLGPMREFIYETIDNADSEEEIIFKKKFGELHDIFVKYYGKDLKVTDGRGRRVAFKDYKVTFEDVFLYTDEYDPEKREYARTDRPLELSFDQWVAFVLNMGNEGNRQRMENWGFSEADMEKIVNAGTERDLEFIQEVWDYLESFKPMIQETHRILTGTSLRWVEPSPVVTKYGTLRGGTGTLPGGYYPIVTDARYNEKAAGRQELEALLDRTRFDHAAAYTKQGFRKQRAERVTGAPPKLELSVLDNHIANVIHDGCFSVALRDVQKVFRSKDVQNAIVNAVGAEKKEAVNRWLQDMAAGRRRNAIQLTGVDKTVQGITANVATSTLGGAIVGPAMQVLGYFPLIHRLGFVNFLYGASKYLRHPADYWQFAVSRSGYLQKNLDSVRNAAIQQTRDVWSYKGKADRFSAQVKAFSMAAFPLCQNLCNVPGWYMSYEVGMKKYDGDEAKAARYADMAVSTTQGGGRLIDQTLAERSSPWNRVVMMFWSWFRVQYGMQNEAFRRAFKERSLASVVNLGSYVFWVLLAQQFTEAWIRGERPDDDGDEGLLAQFAGDPGGGAWWLAKKAAVGAVSAYPVAGPAAQYFVNGGRFRLSPVQSRIESSLRVIKQAGGMVADACEYGFDGLDWDEDDFYRLANGAAELYSLKNGLPIQRFVKMGEAFLRAAEGEDAASLAWDVIRNKRLGSTEGRQ